MGSIVSQLGVDLVEAVASGTLPTTNLDVASIKVNKLTIPQYILYHFVPRRGFQSVLLVGDSVEHLNVYINSMALLLSDRILLEKYVESTCEARDQRDSTEKRDECIEWMLNGLGRTKVRTLEVAKLLQLCRDAGENWIKDVIRPLTPEKYPDYIFAVDEIATICSSNASSPHGALRSQMFSAIKGRRLNFIAAVTWEQYVQHIDGPLNRFCNPVLFSPRPEGWTASDAFGSSPDPYHEFA